MLTDDKELRSRCFPYLFAGAILNRQIDDLSEGSPSARKTHAGKYRESTLWRQRGDGGISLRLTHSEFGIFEQTLINLKTAYKKTDIDIQIQIQSIILNWFWLLIEKGETLLEKTNHPFINMDSQIRGHHPVISGTGIRVIDILIEYEYKGFLT